MEYMGLSCKEMGLSSNCPPIIRSTFHFQLRKASLRETASLSGSTLLAVL